jgi:hypothetical protein
MKISKKFAFPDGEGRGEGIYPLLEYGRAEMDQNWRRGGSCWRFRGQRVHSQYDFSHSVSLFLLAALYAKA